MSHTLRCQCCHEVIGVYEPVIVVVGSQVRETSRAADPELDPDSGEHYHRTCYLERAAAGAA